MKLLLRKNTEQREKEREKMKFSLFYFFPFTFFLFSVLTPWNLIASKSSTASTETIQSITIENQIPSRIPNILDIIRMKKGDIFNQTKLENAINDLRKWGVFKSVEVLLQHQGPHVDITFQLEDAYLIRSIELHGNYPLLESKVRRAIFFSTGDIYEKEKVNEQIGRLIEFYEKEGYRDTVIFISESISEKDRMVTLKINVNRGKTYRIDKVIIVGNNLFKNLRIENKISRFFDYKPSRIKTDLEKIQKLYRAHDYPRIRVKLTNAEFNELKHTVDLTISIRQGKEVEIDFIGNKNQWHSSLMKVIDLAKNGDYDDFELENSKNQLIDHYHKLGYEEMKASFSKKDLSKEKVQVIFSIEEGPRRVVKKIDFDGNEKVKPNNIREIMQTKEESLTHKGVFLNEVFNQDLEKIDNFFVNNGYLDSKIKEWKRYLIPTGDKYIVNIDINAGKRTFINTFRFEGLNKFEASKLHKILKAKAGDIYSPSQIEGELRALLTYFSNQGHPYSEIKVDLEKTSSDKVNIIFNVVEGPEVKIGQILIVGNVKTLPQTILNALKFKSDAQFSAQKILESQTTLRKLGIFDALTIETLGLLGKENTIHVVVRVEERKDNILDFGISYDTDTKLQGKVTYTKLNLWGRGKSLDFKGIGGFRINRGEIMYTDPRFLASDWQMITNAFVEFDRDPFFQDLQIGGTLGFQRQLTKKLTILTKYEMVQTDFVEQKTDFTQLRPGTSDNTTGKLAFIATYDRRDNYGDPHKGYYTFGRTDFGQELNSGSLFFKIQAKFGYWYSPFERLTISNTVRGLFDIPLNHKSIPTQELYFLGGDDTIRGFAYQEMNPAGGQVALIYNLELVFRLFKNFQFVGFLDTASLTNNLSQINLGSIRNAAGPGIRYATPVGPLRLEYGILLDRQAGENFGRIHFTFGYLF